MKKKLELICVIACIALLFGCTDASKATSVLAANGYKNIQITGCNFFACSQDAFYRTGFQAESPNGTIIRGTVCSGLVFKGSVIRFK